jgi:type VI secretion system secreted protein VgrG
VFRLTRGGGSPQASETTALPPDASGTTTGADGTTQLQRSDGPEIYRVSWLGRKK